MPLDKGSARRSEMPHFMSLPTDTPDVIHIVIFRLPLFEDVSAVSLLCEFSIWLLRPSASFSSSGSHQCLLDIHESRSLVVAATSL